jgi:hypothetical protein
MFSVTVMRTRITEYVVTNVSVYLSTAYIWSMARRMDHDILYD